MGEKREWWWRKGKRMRREKAAVGEEIDGMSKEKGAWRRGKGWREM